MLDRQAYIDNLIDYFQNPRNKEIMADADVQVTGGNPGCGDIVTMYVKIEDGVAKRITFEGEGCTISMAGASIVAEKYEGSTLEEFAAVDSMEIIEEMGRDVVYSRLRCATVGIGTLQAAIKEHRRQTIAASN
jgi:nitrogen fixation NifU-like protein